MNLILFLHILISSFLFLRYEKRKLTFYYILYICSNSIFHSLNLYKFSICVVPSLVLLMSNVSYCYLNGLDVGEALEDIANMEGRCLFELQKER